MLVLDVTSLGVDTRYPGRPIRQENGVALSDDIGSASDGVDDANAARRDRAGLEHYRGLFDSLLEGVAYCRMLYDDSGEPMDFVYLDVNPAFARLTGLTDVRGRLVTEIIPDVKRTNPEVFEIYGRVVATGEPATFDLDLKPLGLWLHVVATRPSIGHFLAVFEDITERKSSHDALRASEEIYRDLYEKSPLGYQSLDENGFFLTVNQAWLDVLGYERDEVLGTWFGDLLAPEYVEAFRERFPEFKAAGSIHSEFEMVRKDGERRFVAFDGRIGYDERGAFKQTHCILQDISEKRRAETALRESYERLEALTIQVIEAMGLIVETRDPYTEGHEQRVSRLGRQIALEMGLDEDGVATVETAALLHDIGKLCVPAEILTKPGVLSDSEFRLIKEHSRAGYDILKGIAFPWPIADVVLQHHERMDGSGYPAGLVGEEILPAARILAVADTVEAMSSHRPYRPAFGIARAVEELGLHPEAYDPDAVRACVALFESGRLDL
jgi:PAS domain S-box-containing protein/putative nucleotidyltransferase with HDIG domain